MIKRVKFILVASACAVLTLGVGAGASYAQETASTSELERRRDLSASEFERLTREIGISEKRAAEVENGIAAIRKDNASLSAALVQAAKTERKLATEIEDISERLNLLGLQEAGLRASLAERRGILAEVLGALQRMGLNPPPAILVRPEDALSSVRSSILMAAVVPELRGETEVLLGDLQELARLVASIDNERARLVQTVGEQAAEQKRLSLLLDEKKKLQSQSEAELAAERQRLEDLTSQAASLRELIDAIESEIEMAALQSEPPPEMAGNTANRPPRGSGTLFPGANAPFSALLGQVGLPVGGHVQRRFGESDGHGGTLQGDMLATHSTAIVTAPVDGSVLYAGPFRSYGQLLILNAGDGYHIVLAGLGRISVAPGQSVIAGEPVGLMGETRVASAVAFGEASAGPELYVEFRKDGKPVDPAPWWTERTVGRSGNDT